MTENVGDFFEAGTVMQHPCRRRVSQNVSPTQMLAAADLGIGQTHDALN